ncbi:hypothetical protein MNEG_5743 [Monoraphidium neglectum]|uniref:Rho-GAP domain-containing protein n=1 Tax=Monoraphidium neglectum TaxID=145388 RepID=A0A0D2N966_9CHLO|nr:hypothetical protein MNEG_5743 [Monoraphidium neglectum]KIZ02216.1 hypothetical protein MNEG_5743 [Monoraphidium neglectum]|eukprot:XP_013901235.1 hypothetical protein MNEG_5743 [Monoraphidium neglectum]
MVQAADAEQAPASSHEQNEAQANAAPSQSTFEALKLGSLRLASIIKRSAGVVSRGPAAAPAPAAEPASKEAGDASDQGQEVAARTGEAAPAASSVRASGIGAKIFGEQPLPQLVLACCTALAVGGGVAVAGIFKDEAPHEEVEAVSTLLAGGRMALIPPGTSPHVVAALLKRFLLGLQEPLLTYKLLPDWIIAAGDLGQVGSVAARLPPASANVLRLLLEVCHHVDANAADTEMDARALAEALAPCVAWLPPSLKPYKAPPAATPARATAAPDARPAAGAGAPFAEGAAGPASTDGGAGPGAVAGPDLAAGGAGGGGGFGGAAVLEGAHHPVVPLEGFDAEAIVLVLQALITRFPELYK